jgi:hypothetical protein|nr:MAG TPA: crystallin beta/gamma motif-containing protein [Caudoviricetes sp.]
MDSEKMRILQSEFESRYNPLTYNALHEPKKLSIEQRNFDFLDQQYVKDREWKDVKSFYNGSINLLERSVLGTLAMARDYNIATRREREPNYQPMTEGVAIIDEALKSEHLQPFNVKGDTVAEQFRLDLVQGAGQLATQVAATVFTGGAASTALMGAQIAGNQYLDLKEEGVDTKRAAQASIANAIIQTPLERLSLGKLLKRVPAGSTLGKKLKQIGESALTEAFTEGIQQYPEEITNMIAKNEGKSIQELAAEFDKNVGTYTKNALYAGLIGGILGGGASTIRVALDRNVHKEQLNTLEERIDNVKKSGAEPAYAASVINSNLQGSKISIDAEALYQYAQTQNIDEIAASLGVEANNIERAAQEGLDIDIMQGNFEVMAAQKPDFYSAVKDSIIFEDNGYSISKEKMQKELQKEYQRLDINDEEFRVWKDTRIQELLSAGATKQEALDTVALLSSHANIANPDDPMQYFRDKPVSFKRVVSTPNGRYMQTKSANEKLLEDENNFAANIDKFISGKLVDKTIRVMQTPLALEVAGAKILPVDMSVENLDKVLNGKHKSDMSADIVKQIPRALTDPLMIFDTYDGKNGAKRKIVALDLKSKNGATIVVPFELEVDNKSNKYVMNEIISAYGKTDNKTGEPRYEWFAKQIENGKLRYINKEKTAKLIENEKPEWLMPFSTDSGFVKTDKLLQSPSSDSASRITDLDSLLNNSIPDENALRKRREEMQGYYQAEGKTKGAITWDEEGKAIISLFEGADMSTVIHEAVGHYFIENLMREGALPNATEQMKKDRQTMLDYAELTELEWNQLNKPFEELTEEQQKRKTAAHERWATAAEQYIMLGKSPSKEMQGPLSRFQKWLLETYKTIKDFISTNEYAVPITQEVQEVFDRMLASQEDINIMERVDGYFAKLPSVITDNLSEASKRRLQNVIVKAHEKAVNLLTKQSLENFTDQRKMQIEEYRAEILPAIRQELEQQPIYAAENMLLEDFPKYKTGKAVAEYYRKLLSRAMDIESKPLNEKEELDIVKFDMISEASGFTSGDELSSKLLSEPALQQAITLYADEMVQTKFPDIYKERRLAEQAAREAFYTDDSGLVIGVEQQIIEDAAAGILAQQRSAEQALALARARRQQAKLAAKTELSNMVVADAVRTSKYISAERRAAAKAIDAAKKNDYDSALKYKRLQALNHAMVQESLNMRAKIEQYKKYLKRQMKAKKDTWVDEKHFVQAAALMERMGLNHKEYNPEFRTQSLAEYAAAMQNEYDNVSIADWLLDENRTFISPMQTLTFDRFEDVINALKNIKAISKQEKYITWYGKALDYKEFKDQAIENLLKLKTKWQSGINSKENVKPQQRLVRSLTNTDNFFERMDGWKYGFFSKHFGESVQIAANKKAVYTMEFEERIADATKKWLPDKKAVEAADKEIYYEALNANVSKHNLIKMLLYLGTESSSYKLCSVREKSTYTEFFRGSDLWVEGDVELTRSNLLEFLGNVLTEADINYAQKVVDACNAHWDETSDMVKRMTGFSPERVDALPAELTLRNGAKVVFRGGYVPLVRYSDSGSHPAALDAVPATNDKRSVNSIRTLHTNTGGTKTRDKSVYPLDLRKGAEYSAVMDNIHDLCYRELTTSFRKIMNDPEMYSLLKEKLGIANFEAFEEFLKKTAQPYGSGGYSSISERDAGDCLSWIRQKTVNVAIMLNFKTAVQNLGNPLLYGNVVEGFGYKDVMAAYGNLFLNMQNGQGWRTTRDLVYSKSPFMKERSIVPDISMRDIKDEGRKLNPVERIAVEFGTNVLVATDNISAIPIWAQAYQKKINAGASEQEAVLFAETVIRRTLGSSRITDVAPIQRGSALMKLFTTFQGFFNTQFNQWQREFGIFGREWSAGRKAEASKRIVAFAAAKYFMFCLLNLALALEPPFEEDDDGWVKYGKELLQYPMSLLGPVGQVANTLVSNMVGMRTYGYRMTAVQGAFEQLERTGAKLGKVIQGKAESEEAVEPLANLGGLIAGVPAQFNKLFFNAYDIVVNDMEPQWGDIYRRRPKRER